MCLNDRDFEKRKMSLKFANETLELEVNHFNFFTHPVSIHTPLQQFLATLIVGYNDLDQQEWASRGSLSGLCKSTTYELTPGDR